MRERFAFEREIDLLAGPSVAVAEREASAPASACEARWRAEMGKYPPDVQRAVRNTPADGPYNLIAWAKQKGIARTDALTRLVYYATYGRQLGYCAPATPLAKRTWTNIERLVKGYLARPWPPLYQVGPSPCAKQKRTVTADAPAFDVTGRYYSVDPTRLYVFNQAGTHVEGYFSEVIRASPAREIGGDSNRKRGDRPFWECSADLHGQELLFFNRTQPAEWGRLRVVGGTLHLDDTPLKRIDARPTLFMGLPGRKPDLSDVHKRHELAPLDPDSLLRIAEILNKPHLDRIFDVFFNKGGRQNQETAVQALHRTVDLGSDDITDYQPWLRAPKALEEFHLSDMPLVRLFARRLLTINKWTSSRKVTRSHIDWIQMMLDLELPSGTPTAQDFQTYFGLRSNRQRAAATGEHVYRCALKLTGASLIAGGYIGSITVEKTTGAHRFKKTFDIELAGGTVALTLFDWKIGDEFSGAGASYVEWTENDIPGPVNYARASASIGFGTASAQLGFMHILGNETMPPLEIFFQDADLGIPDVESIRKMLEDKQRKKEKVTGKDVLDFDVSASVLRGEILPPGTLLDRLRGKTDYRSIDLSRAWDGRVAVSRSLDAQVHFCLNDPVPTDEARQALRMLCARELPTFMTPAARLAVVGHADTLGKVPDNITLSKGRAENTVRAMEQILGPKFRIDKRNVVTLGLGELLALFESKGKTVPNPGRRRVDIYLNGDLVLSLGS